MTTGKIKFYAGSKKGWLSRGLWVAFLFVLALIVWTLYLAQAEAGGPELRLDKPNEWINTDARLGNTGSASWFMNMALGVMGSYIDGGVSAAINLRNDREASLIFISPPPPEKLKAQGSAIFKNQVTPAIDPANYQQQ